MSRRSACHLVEMLIRCRLLTLGHLLLLDEAFYLFKGVVVSVIDVSIAFIAVVFCVFCVVASVKRVEMLSTSLPIVGSPESAIPSRSSD